MPCFKNNWNKIKVNPKKMQEKKPIFLSLDVLLKYNMNAMFNNFGNEQNDTRLLNCFLSMLSICCLVH